MVYFKDFSRPNKEMKSVLFEDFNRIQGLLKTTRITIQGLFKTTRITIQDLFKIKIKQAKEPQLYIFFLLNFI